MDADESPGEVTLHPVLEAGDVGVVGDQVVYCKSVSASSKVCINNLQLSVSVEPVVEAAFDRSRRRQRSLRPRPLIRGLAGRPPIAGDMGPRRTVMFLNGPSVTQPEPLPAARTMLGEAWDGMPVSLCGMNSPSPLMDVSLPSNKGEPTMS